MCAGARLVLRGPVAWRGEVVASGPPPGTNGWVPVLITCNGTHVNASVNGALLAHDAPADIAAALARLVATDSWLSATWARHSTPKAMR